MSLGSIFIGMDFTSVEEHLNKLTEKGEEELEKLKSEKETMQKELDVSLIAMDGMIDRRSRRNCMPVLEIWLFWVKCILSCFALNHIQCSMVSSRWVGRIEKKKASFRQICFLSGKSCLVS